MKVVLANGVFDILHPGHVSHLKQARSMGDVLIVSLTSDEYVNKPGRPIHTWEDRAEVLRELRSVSMVFKTNTAVDAILAIKPDIFVKGIDYAKGDNFTEDIQGACKKTGTLLCFTNTPKRSVTELINECQRKIR